MISVVFESLIIAIRIFFSEMSDEATTLYASDSQPGATWPPRGEFTSLGEEYRAFGELGEEWTPSGGINK